MEMARFTCQAVLMSYINLKGTAASEGHRALGQSPEYHISVSCPGMEGSVPAGASLFNQTINKSHDQPGHNSGQAVKQKLLHCHSSLWPFFVSISM